ncbi:response regulator (plasmid) [Nostoc edaphicum CCNP1411]|uniref:Response regulator n=1 Tax=Nostoc edaphicum CCNP1411 TaxID=1472755 RepID=A0A7D7L8W8_9NOSO|nr:response regulator [Nostoc edaphicum CCNP1411]
MVESSRCGGTALRNLSSDKGKILVVDDEASIRRILQTRLEMIGYSVVTASDGEEALSAFRLLTPDLIVLDVMMPKLDGYGVCQELRKQSDVPIIMLTALGDVADRITGLELGADDYMTKPFSPKELEARIACVLKRRSHKTSINTIPNSLIIHVGNLKIDINKRQVHKNEQRIRLTGIEFSLLELLVNHSGKVRLLMHELSSIDFSLQNLTKLITNNVYLSSVREKNTIRFAVYQNSKTQPHQNEGENLASITAEYQSDTR